MPERMRALQAAAGEVLGWSAQQLADELQITRGHLKSIETGNRRASVALTRRVKKVENDLAYCAKEASEMDVNTLAWVVEALEHHGNRLTAAQRKRIERIVRR